MKVCDRDGAVAVETIVFESDDQRIDLCASCKMQIMEFISGTTVEEERGKGERRTRLPAGTAQN
jgi:hypothetical protein